MGLGKTLQTIAFLSAALAKTGDREADERTPAARARALGVQTLGPVLVVVGNSLLGNWSAELARWGTFNVTTAHPGAKWAAAVERAAAGGVDVVLTTSRTLLNHNKEGLSSAGFQWDIIVVDEAHSLKKASNVTTVAVRGVPARMRVGLSGTPMPNAHKVSGDRASGLGGRGAAKALGGALARARARGCLSRRPANLPPPPVPRPSLRLPHPAPPTRNCSIWLTGWCPASLDWTRTPSKMSWASPSARARRRVHRPNRLWRETSHWPRCAPASTPSCCAAPRT